MASPVWQTGVATAGTTATSKAVTLPSSIAANDIVIVTLYKEDTGAVTPPAGFTEKTATGVPPTTNGPQAQHTFWKRMAGGESGTVSFSWTANVYNAAVADRFSGCTTSGDPISDINGNFNNTSGTPTPAVSLTGTPTDSILYWASTNFSGGSSFNPPGTFTEREDLIDVLECATKDNAAGGNTGSLSGSANIAGKLTSVVLNLISVGPAVGGTPQPAQFLTYNHPVSYRETYRQAR